MNGFDIAAVLAVIAATCGYVNHRLLRLPATTGTLAVALVSSIALLFADRVFASLGLADAAAAFLSAIDFNETLMHGMLSFLLFAGALHVDLAGLLKNKWTIGILSTVGVMVSTAIVGLLTWRGFALVGTSVPFVVCLAFGALISPTDPIAVMGLLKELRAPRDLEAEIAGESLFNDGIGVVVFFAVMSVAGWSALEPAPAVGDERICRAHSLVARHVVGSRVDHQPRRARRAPRGGVERSVGYGRALCGNVDYGRGTPRLARMGKGGGDRDPGVGCG